MPTLECLDERSRAILARLDDMSEHFDANFKELRAESSTRLRAIEEDVYELKLRMASDDGKRAAAVWIGGVALTALAAIFGAVGNILYTWIIGPHGPLKNF